MALVKDKTRLKNRLQTLTLAFTLKQAKARLDLDDATRNHILSF